MTRRSFVCGYIRVLLVLSVASFLCAQLTFSPKSRWSKNLFLESQGAANAGKMVPLNSFEWSDMNDFLKSQFQANPLKVIQSLISLGTNTPVSQFDEVPLERRSKSLQSNRIGSTFLSGNDKNPMKLLQDDYSE